MCVESGIQQQKASNGKFNVELDERRMNGFNTFNLLRQGHVALRGWPETARAAHAQIKAREAARGGERNEILDR